MTARTSPRLFSSRRRHTRSLCDWSSDVCSSDLELIAEMLRQTVSQCGEPITMMLFGTGGPEVPWAQRVFTTRQLKAGDLINTEVEGKYAGYIAQALQPISLGPKPQQLEKIFAETKIIFDRMLKILKPGV